MFRRKTMPPELVPAQQTFVGQAERVERARQALLRCLPVGRVDPAPVPMGLDLLRDELRGVADQMNRWRVSAMEAWWQRCVAAITESLAAVEPAREVATRTAELEELLDAVTAVVEPLDVWGEAERAWLRLRTRTRNGSGDAEVPGTVS